MTVTISLEQAVRVAREVAKERPHHIDTMKGFSHNHGCLAGVVLYRLGMEELYYRPSPEEKVTLGDAPVRYMGIAINSPGVAMSVGVISCSDETLNFLEALMQFNDQNCPWGAAVRNAEKYCELRFGIEIPQEKKKAYDPWAVEAIRASDPKPDPEEEEKEEDKESAAMWEQLYDQINNPENKESDAAHLVSAGA